MAIMMKNGATIEQALALLFPLLLPAYHFSREISFQESR